MEHVDPQLKVTIERAFQSLSNINGPHERRQTFLSFGNKEILKYMFIESFKKYDTTIKEFQWLVEYNEIIDWLEDSHGKGLYLTGDCGRGKTNIIFGVLVPLYLIRYKTFLPGYHATQLTDMVLPQFDNLCRWNYELYNRWKIAYIDELGTERMVNDFGEKFEPFNEILNVAEQKLHVLIISSNLNGEQFLNRYGDRTMDRIKRLCKIITFEGESLRV
jgi:DNA replication protein DnaC